MTDPQWESLLRVFDGELLDELPIGFIIDSPWLPGWSGISILDYYSSERLWLESNLKAIRQFPQVTFLPGFWSEFGMCTEPASFGAKCVFPENEFPFAEKVLDSFDEVARLTKPDCRVDGLSPFVIKRLQNCRKDIEAAGHRIRFAVSRGPLNIASFLAGHTETLMAVKTEPEAAARLIDLVTDFVIDWLSYQRECFDSIDGILVLDDLIGFLGEGDFRQFALPCFQRISAALDVRIKALHNDARGLVTAKCLPEMGFNLFNFAYSHSLSEIRQLVGDDVVLLGNLPPRDILAAGSPDDVRRETRAMVDSIEDKRRVVFSCGGGMPPNVSTQNIEAFCQTVRG
ncbi:MAG: uroporphyrinogen decarboxylase [Planctomycetaceae bacterium]|nr:uroporphyrinogen decarboxylase [Planctomycetaceae bacterium]